MRRPGSLRITICTLNQGKTADNDEQFWPDLAAQFWPDLAAQFWPDLAAQLVHFIIDFGHSCASSFFFFFFSGPSVPIGWG